MTPEEKLDRIAEWHDQWGDVDLADLDSGTIWQELNELLYPKSQQDRPAGVVVNGPWLEDDDSPAVLLSTPEPPKRPLPGRWYE